jgi:hypothetical protein
MMQKRYTCPGSCGGVLNVAEWKDETPTCSDEDCELHGEELNAQKHCDKCNTTVEKGQHHKCDASYIG